MKIKKFIKFIKEKIIIRKWNKKIQKQCKYWKKYPEHNGPFLGEQLFEEINKKIDYENEMIEYINGCKRK